MHPDFQPALFAHGRLLWRSEGSDSARFSPRNAWNMVQAAAARSGGAGLLWDPFCGTGLIPAVARLFFHDHFLSVWASDLHEPAIDVARRNLRLVSDPAMAATRRRQVQGRMGQNPKSETRWGDVRRYLDRLTPHIQAAAQSTLQTHVVLGAAAEIRPSGAPVCIVGDAPYGKQSALIGPPLASLIEAWTLDDNVVYIDMMCSKEQAETVAQSGAAGIEPARGARCRIRFDRG